MPLYFSYCLYGVQPYLPCEVRAPPSLDADLCKPPDILLAIEPSLAKAFAPVDIPDIIDIIESPIDLDYTYIVIRLSDSCCF